MALKLRYHVPANLEARRQWHMRSARVTYSILISINENTICDVRELQDDPKKAWDVLANKYGKPPEFPMNNNLIPEMVVLPLFGEEEIQRDDEEEEEEEHGNIEREDNDIEQVDRENSETGGIEKFVDDVEDEVTYKLIHEEEDESVKDDQIQFEDKKEERLIRIKNGRHHHHPSHFLSSKPYSPPPPLPSTAASPTSPSNPTNPNHSSFSLSDNLCKLGLHSLQHRGQEGAAASSPPTAAPSAASPASASSPRFSRTRPAAVGHNRYSTAGSASSLANVQPFLASYRFGQLAVAHNGNLVNYKSLRAALERKGSIFSSSSDTEVIQHLIATSTSRPLLARIVEACESLEGAYWLVFLTADKLIAVRDPNGFRPLVMGRRPGTGAVVFASETCALDLIRADYIREVNPGEVVVVDGGTMEITSLCLMPRKPRTACIFEHVYFALPNSVVFGHSVYASRYAFGEALARESPVPGADIVIPVPDSGFFAALGFSNVSGLPFWQGLIRSHYVPRTFIQPMQEARDLAVRLKLGAIKGILKGKSVVVIDDSIVRGTTSSQIIQHIKNEGGAREVHMRIASPPMIGSCYYGVDNPRAEELISYRKDVEGVRKKIECDSLAFLSLDSLKGHFADEGDMFCDVCFTRKYPVPPKPHVVVNSGEE